ncbi:MAG: D-alanyl-D-alanine carboxypeptidase family protein [Peptococcaceae bacterium]|jgi:D-alanyl-D-alanine carboxypeptidase|nr:D-alanyl-D-alanine carboxypeptidase family protein [Peptococcaceae bacterium]
MKAGESDEEAKGLGAGAAAWLEGRRPVIQLFALPALMIAVLAALLVWHDYRTAAGAVYASPDGPGGAAQAAIPGRPGAAVSAADAQSADDQSAGAQSPAIPSLPQLPPGEDYRAGTRYEGETVALLVTPADIYRGRLILVNYQNLLPEGYAPESLVEANELMAADDPSQFAVTKDLLRINSEAAERLLEMIRYAAERDGIRGYLLVSGHRDFSYQTGLYRRKVTSYQDMGYSEDDAKTAAAVWVARPRESEHHTGLAMDVSSKDHPGLETSYFQTANGRWLDENAWRFGFVVRYPQDKTDITKIGYEPWHLRYVGRPHSDFIRRRGWCLEEYLDFLRQEGGYTFKDEEGRIWQVDYQTGWDGQIRVPGDGDYQISGDGEGGFVVTVPLTADDTG